MLEATFGGRIEVVGNPKQPRSSTWLATRCGGLTAAHTHVVSTCNHGTSSTGAFEVSMSDGTVLFSKFEKGRFPVVQARCAAAAIELV